MRNQQPITNNQRGFALFMSVVIAGTLLVIATGIVSLAVRQALLSTSARESQYAFYAADTGVECALYWDFKTGAFSPESPPSDIKCVETTTTVGGGAYGVPTTFRLYFLPQPYCVDVTVTKINVPVRKTYIDARGYNTCNEDNPRRVERAIRVTY